MNLHETSAFLMNATLGYSDFDFLAARLGFRRVAERALSSLCGLGFILSIRFKTSSRSFALARSVKLIPIEPVNNGPSRPNY